MTKIPVEFEQDARAATRGIDSCRERTDARNELSAKGVDT